MKNSKSLRAIHEACVGVKTNGKNYTVVSNLSPRMTEEEERVVRAGLRLNDYPDSSQATESGSTQIGYNEGPNPLISRVHDKLYQSMY